MTQKFNFTIDLLASIKSENFRVSLYSKESINDSIEIDSIDGNIDFPLEQLEELIQALMLFRDQNLTKKSHEVIV